MTFCAYPLSHLESDINTERLFNKKTVTGSLNYIRIANKSRKTANFKYRKTVCNRFFVREKDLSVCKYFDGAIINT